MRTEGAYDYCVEVIAWTHGSGGGSNRRSEQITRRGGSYFCSSSRIIRTNQTKDNETGGTCDTRGSM